MSLIHSGRVNLRALALGITAAIGLILSGTPEVLAASKRTLATLPSWVKPLAKLEHPTGDYLHDDDQWLTLYSAVTVSAAESGGLRLDYRALYRSLSDEPAVFAKSFDYDEASETLNPPVMFYQARGTRWMRVDNRRSSVDVPATESGFVTADRRFIVSTKEIRPGNHVAVTWSVIEKDAYPAERAIFPIESFPVVEHVVEVEDGADVRMLDVRPDANRAPLRVTRLAHKEIPGQSRLFANVGWQASVFHEMPHAFVTRAQLDEVNWKTAGARVRKLFDASLDRDRGDRDASVTSDYVTHTKTLVEGIESQYQKIAALSEFAQALSYRDVEWGLGAYQPDSPDEVLRTRSGDCKAKTLILHAMLKEIGVESTPVLARLGQPRLSASALASGQIPAHGGYFNHMVLAIDAPPGAGDAARLTKGSGEGWLLFDPTDSQATFGLPPRYLEGTPAVWLAGDSELFEVALAGDADYSQLDLEIRLDSVDPTAQAEFSLQVSGASTYADHVANNQLEGQGSASLQKQTQRVLRTFLPGASLSSLEYSKPEAARGQTASVSLTGSLASPLRQVSPGLHTFAAPMLLARHTFALQTQKLKLDMPEPLEGLAAQFEMPLCCSGKTRNMQVNIDVLLPPGWSLHNTPRLKAIDAPWLQASVQKQGQRWSASVAFPAGNFTAADGKLDVDARISDLNRLAKVWRGKFIVKEEAR